MNRVVVTGIGAVSPIGNSFPESWNSAKTGKSGIGRVTKCDTTDLQWKVAGELKGFDARSYLARKEILRLDIFVQYAVAAALMAAEDAGLKDLQSAGVIIGSSRGGISTLEKEMKKIYASSGPGGTFRISPYLMASTTISMASSFVAQKLGVKGYSLGISNACASGTSAIGEAFRMIRSGFQYPVICGGTEAPICRICIMGYGSSGALSRVSDASASRPFDRTRDGFVLSEGACIMVLEEYMHAVRRGARIYGEIAGYGNTADAYHQTKPSAEGEARGISMAIGEAGIGTGSIGFLTAHGTSTPLGDRTETEAIKRAFQADAYRLPVTSVKSMTGHMLAASGSLEAGFTLMSIREGIIPPTLHLKERDPDCDLDYVTETRRTGIRYAMSESFGFGGINAVLVFKNPDF